MAEKGYLTEEELDKLAAEGGEETISQEELDSLPPSQSMPELSAEDMDKLEASGEAEELTPEQVSQFMPRLELPTEGREMLDPETEAMLERETPTLAGLGRAMVKALPDIASATLAGATQGTSLAATTLYRQMVAQYGPRAAQMIAAAVGSYGGKAMQTGIEEQRLPDMDEAASALATGAIAEGGGQVAGRAVQKGAEGFARVGTWFDEVAEAADIRAAAKIMDVEVTQEMLTNSTWLRKLEKSIRERSGFVANMQQGKIEKIRKGFEATRNRIMKLRSKEAVEALADATPASIGGEAKQAMIDEVDELGREAKIIYNNLDAKYADKMINKEESLALSDFIDSTVDSIDADWAPGVAAAFQSSGKKVVTFAQLRKLRTRVGKVVPKDPNEAEFSHFVYEHLTEIRDRAFHRLAGGKDPSLVKADRIYKDVSQKIDTIKRVFGKGTKKGGSPTTFKTRLGAMTDEDVAKNFMKLNDEATILALHDNFPQTFEKAKQQIFHEIYSKSHLPGLGIDPAKFSKELSKITPPVRGVLFGEENIELTDAAKYLGEYMPESANALIQGGHMSSIKQYLNRIGHGVQSGLFGGLAGTSTGSTALGFTSALVYEADIPRLMLAKSIAPTSKWIGKAGDAVAKSSASEVARAATRATVYGPTSSVSKIKFNPKSPKLMFQGFEYSRLEKIPPDLFDSYVKSLMVRKDLSSVERAKRYGLAQRFKLGVTDNIIKSVPRDDKLLNDRAIMQQQILDKQEGRDDGEMAE